MNSKGPHGIVRFLFAFLPMVQFLPQRFHPPQFDTLLNFVNFLQLSLIFFAFQCGLWYAIMDLL